MNALTNIQYIHDEQGNPAFAVVPLATLEWLKSKAGLKNPLDTGVPYEVAALALKQDISAVRAWREYLNLTQAEVAARLGVSQSAYCQYENATRLRKSTKQKIADALNLHLEQLDF
ncbi:helix-turn-helix transcriptional regulator [Avibacterium paragallinarum]|uniref:helix-turn-helix domain-containing protein n=1 Tax=Avibacterium TaxID=292486 RepID=UPI0021F7D10D|nr:helix-turn-helix transcriptional regulator [Avibacterium paragallinarum]UXN37594.1 helix-turn-helix transcriptional regulator [Avibacterium paragallinarum]